MTKRTTAVTMVQGGRQTVERISRNYILNIGRVGGLNATMLFVMVELRAQSIADSKNFA